MKKFIIPILFCIMMATHSVCAYNYPSQFWPVNTKYEEAYASKDHAGIIEYGKQIINIMSSAPEGEEKNKVIVPRYKEIGISYAALGDYDNALETFKKLYDYTTPLGDKYYDYAKGAENRILQYTSAISMYTDGGQSPYYGAVNEKGNGVLFGLCSNGGTRSKLDNESMVLTYQELGQQLIAYNTGVMRDASSDGLAVEFALNCPKQGTDIRNIRKMDSYLKEISDLFNKYPNVPVYLRFAAEFNVWENKATPEEFIDAFRYVSMYFKNRNSNVAIVWSPNHVSDWNTDVHDFYPGDGYVDWVGMSLYAEKYFLGNPYEEEESEIAFRSGINSDPVIAVKDIVERYGDRKPIMLSESGCGHKVVESGENTTDFALRRLKEYYYYLPMVYPQIKLIAYFDWYVNADTEESDFRLSTNTALQNEYLRLVKGRRFIQNGYSNNVGFCYRPIYNGIAVENIFEVSCYAHLYNANIKSVTYFIDDNYEGMSSEIPYTTMVDASGYTGNHILKAVATFDNGKTLSTESNVYINNNSKNITVEIDNQKVNFDQEPILYNNRTMVPMRKIFEGLGASVSWDSETQTVTGRRGDRTVRITIGQTTMYVNNKAVELDTAPFILAARTLVPARAVAEGLGCNVDWNGTYNLVSITPKVFTWSEWGKNLPSHVDEDMYYIEKREEYRYRTREEEYFTLDYRTYNYNFVKENVSYGSWGEWQNSYISASDNFEVDVRTQSSPKRYHYAHYCTGGYINDQAKKFRTSSSWWHDECTYHDLGWFDSPLPYSEDSTDDYAYYVDGVRYRCSNTCYRWYLIETTGGEYTQYRSRPIYRKYEYWDWSEWSRWSDWDTDDPYDYYYRYDDSVDVESRTVYRYKEKG